MNPLSKRLCDMTGAEYIAISQASSVTWMTIVALSGAVWFAARWWWRRHLARRAYEPPTVTPVGNLRDQLAHVDAPEPAPELVAGLACQRCGGGVHLGAAGLRCVKCFTTAPDMFGVLPPKNTEPGHSSPDPQGQNALRDVDPDGVFRG